MQAQSRQFPLGRFPQRTAPLSAVANAVSPALVLIAILLFLPDELSFYFGEFRLTPIRLVLFLLTPFLLFRFIQLLASKKRQLVISDILVLLAAAWMIISPAILFDLGYSLHHSGPSAVEFCGGYLAARVLLSRRGEALGFINLMCHVIAIVAVLGALDSVFGSPLIHNFVGRLMGLPTVTAGEGGLQYRLGVLRAMGPIIHPILFGIVCAVGLLLGVMSSARVKALTIGACALGVMLSLSSAPILGSMLGLCLLAYDHTLSGFRGRWFVLIGIVALGFGALSLLVSSPFAFLFGHLDLDPTSYWVRLLQWNAAGAVVKESPWFGIAFQWPEMVKQMPFFVQTSIDSLWLYLALVYGIPGAVLVGLSLVSAACYPTTGRGVNLTSDEAKMANSLSVVIIVIVLLGFTVDLWESTLIFIGLLVGLRAHFADRRLESTSRLRKPNRGARQRLSLSPSSSG